MKLENYILGKWVTGDGDGKALYDAISGAELATASSAGLDFKDILQYGREIGGPQLRKMTFHERGRMLKALALHLTSIKEKFYELSYSTGATKGDSWVDIDGGIGTVMSTKERTEHFCEFGSGGDAGIGLCPDDICRCAPGELLQGCGRSRW